MFLTNHTLVASAIAVSFPEPSLVVPLAFGSHFILDALPHYGLKIGNNRKKHGITGAIDALIAISIAIFFCFLFPQKILLILLASFFAALPDLNQVLWVFTGIKWPKKYWDFHEAIQRYESKKGILIEIIFALILLFLIIR
ncbi:MAG: hypothetical protein M1355_01375 [Patescibacteria group bacterium]|nr:hypothetical protein [Patescibacteria group bacterium]